MQLDSAFLTVLFLSFSQLTFSAVSEGKSPFTVLYDLKHEPQKMEMKDHTLYLGFRGMNPNLVTTTVADPEMDSYDVTNPLRPIKNPPVENSSGFLPLKVVDHFLYAYDYVKNLHVYDVQRPNSPKLIQKLRVGADKKASMPGIFFDEQYMAFINSYKGDDVLYLYKRDATNGRLSEFKTVKAPAGVLPPSHSNTVNRVVIAHGNAFVFLSNYCETIKLWRFNIEKPEERSITGINSSDQCMGKVSLIPEELTDSFNIAIALHDSLGVLGSIMAATGPQWTDIIPTDNWVSTLKKVNSTTVLAPTYFGLLVLQKDLFHYDSKVIPTPLSNRSSCLVTDDKGVFIAQETNTWGVGVANLAFAKWSDLGISPNGK